MSQTNDLNITFIALATIAIAVVVALVLKGSGPEKKKIALSPDTFQPFKLVSKTNVSHDTRILRFALQSPEHVLGLPIGQHMYLKAMVDGAEVQRAYTPISSDDEVGYFELLIKVYFKNVHPKFPEGGKLTQYLENMKVGDEILVKGPSGRFEYVGHSKFSTKKPRAEPVYRKVKAFGMIAGGSGITPMYQIIKAVLKNPADPTLIYLLFANQTEADILLRGELDAIAKDPRVKVWYTVDRPEEGWSYSSGFINEEMLKNHMPPADGESVILMCGPPPMINFACKPNLEKLGFKAEDMFTF